jgi:hypothetical protein
MEHKYQDEINATLDALDGVKRAKPRPFFYGRLLSRMENSREESSGWSVGIVMPKMAWAVGMCILLLNVSAIIYNQYRNLVSTADQDTSVIFYYGWDETDSIY